MINHATCPLPHHEKHLSTITITPTPTLGPPP